MSVRVTRQAETERDQKGMSHRGSFSANPGGEMKIWRYYLYVNSPHIEAGDELLVIFEDLLGRLVEGILALNGRGEDDSVTFNSK